MAAVVVYHAAPGAMPGGFVGVDVFFVLSGYLITALLAREWAGSGRIDIPAFYARRVRRLLPALLAMLLGVMLLLVAFMGRHESLIEDVGSSSLHAIAFIANFHFQATSGGYFDAASDTRLLLHVWSLAVEEQFYLVYPLVLAGLLRFFAAAPARRLVLLSIASLLLAEYWVHIDPALAFYQMPARFWELSAGGLVALSPSVAGQPKSRGWLLPTGLAIILVACVATGSLGAFPGKSAIPVVVGSAMVLLAVHRGQVLGWAGRTLRSAPLVGLGLVSYSLYLWHWPLLVLLDQSSPEPPGWGWRLGACVGALVIAVASWRFIERPFRQGPLVAGKAIGFGLLACLVAAATLQGLAAIDRVPLKERMIADRARADMPDIFRNCHFDARQRVDSLKPGSCNSIPSVEPTYALWGDSHALAWQPFVWRIAASADASAAPLTLNSCPPGDASTAGRVTADCQHFNQLALEWLAHAPLDTLVVAQRWPIGLSDQGAAPDLLVDRVEALSRALKRLGHIRRIVVLGPLPTIKRPAPECIALDWMDDCSTSAAHHRARVDRAWKVIGRLRAHHPNVEFVDPTDYFCDPDKCPPVRHGFGLYWDSSHITASASRGFAESYLEAPAQYARRPERPTTTGDRSVR